MKQCTRKCFPPKILKRMTKAVQIGSNQLFWIWIWHLVYSNETQRLFAPLENGSFSMGILTDTKSSGLHMRRECRERFLRHRSLATPTCIKARAWCTCHGACRDRQLAVSFEVGGGENLAGIPSACATSNIAYMVRGPLAQLPEHTIFMWHFY